MIAFEVGAAAKGWLHDGEGEYLYHLASTADGPFVELGSYCGKSACYLGEAAKRQGTLLFSIDHHRGSPEMRTGQDCYDPEVVGPDGHDTLPLFRRTILEAGLEGVVIPIVSDSATAARYWCHTIGLLFIDAGHDEQAQSDYRLWGRNVREGGLLLFHDCEIPAIRAAIDMALHDGFETVEVFKNSLWVLHR